jgi:hypothetical protein
MEWALALVALALLSVAAVSRRLSETPITPAILFVAFGMLVGPEVLDGIDLASSSCNCRARSGAADTTRPGSLAGAGAWWGHLPSPSA